MADYEKMYHRLFNSVTNAITILQAAQNDTEEIYINSEAVVLDFLKIVPKQCDNGNVEDEHTAVVVE